MKKFLIIALLPAFAAGCGGGTSAGRVKEKSFAQQYAEMEKNPPTEQAAYDNNAFQTAEDRSAEVAIAAQQERRAQPPLIESNYIFQVMPYRKNVYSYDEYNRVWTDAPADKDYKAEKRLWTKPKRHKGDYEAPAAAPAQTAPTTAAPSPEAEPDEDFDWGEN